MRERTRTAADAPPAAEGSLLLRVQDLRSGYGIRPVLHGISFEVLAGQTVVVLGLNGAGKTTTAKVLCGALPAWAGRVEFDGAVMAGWPVRRCVKEGIVMVPEGRRVFPDLTVEKNLEVGAWSQRRHGAWFGEQRDRVYEYFPRLRERSEQLAGTLSGGEQQMLAIARGLMARPRLLIIDEASLGLAPVIVESVFDIVRQIKEDGVTVILVEQHVGALKIADVALVMEQGTVAATFRGDELADPSRVREVFLG